MRDFGILIWVVFLVIGVVGSMVSSARRQLAAGKEPTPTPVPPQWKPQGGPQVASPQQTSSPQQLLVQALQARVQAPAPSPRLAPRPVQPRPAPPRPAAVPPSEPPAAPESRARRRSPFGTGSELVRAVIAAEVLGKPRGLNDEYR